jgi:hypothetical protein
MKVLSIPFSNPGKMQDELQNITNIEFNVRHGEYRGRSYVSLFNFFTAQSIDIFEGELLKVRILQDKQGINHYELERF